MGTNRLTNNDNMLMKLKMTLFLLLTVALSASAQVSNKKGDANNAGKVTITDAVSVVNNILGNSVGTFNKTQADVNKDGKITISDAVGIVNIILKGGGKPRLVVLKKSGGKDYYYLSDTPVTTFKSGNLVITTSSTEVSYPLATIQRYEYDSVDDDIDELAPEAGNDVHVLRDGNTLTLTNLREGTTASLYGSNGQLLETFKGQGRPVIISVDARPDGVYMVKTGNQTIKLIKQ